MPAPPDTSAAEAGGTGTAAEAALHLRAVAGLHVAALLFGLTGVIGAALDQDAVSIALARTLIASVALALIALGRGERVRPSTALARNGLLLAIHWATFFAAVRVGGVAAGALGYASFPMFVVLLEHRAGTRFDRRAALTLLLVCGGLALTAAGKGFGPSPQLGLALGVASGLAFAVLVVRNRGHAATQPAVSLALWQNVFAALWLLPAWLMLPLLGMRELGTPDLRTLALLLMLGVGCTAFAHSLLIGAMRAVSARVASVIVALEPVYAIALSALLLAQVPDAWTLAGGALVIAAAVVASRQPPVAV